MSDDITEYEQERLKNVERNKKLITKLFSKEKNNKDNFSEDDDFFSDEEILSEDFHLSLDEEDDFVEEKYKGKMNHIEKEEEEEEEKKIKSNRDTKKAIKSNNKIENVLKRKKIKEDFYQLEIDRIFNSFYSKSSTNIISKQQEEQYQCTNCSKKESKIYFNGPAGFYSLCYECSNDFYSGRLSLNQNGKKLFL